jgi:hypothetical protein
MGCGKGSTPLVSTARMASTMLKKPLIWSNMRWPSSGGSSNRAKLAIRSISWAVNDIKINSLQALYWR